ncbi:phosphatase PAP2 family protein [Draconibacterium sp. IB214405]|uniref:phosphatase PAP2 family protein n=1 Tax=Draconibacterium sp. IB214405 TaxID=3097352 RepID=UPI002A0B00F6|nr:phosphatase PAP2 family protein [Draconibacterium sp. IB214405]MDX8340994.1 phosphatase PAP2 family protein [Draconibacterium sp. IB214405]
MKTILILSSLFLLNSYNSFSSEHDKDSLSINNDLEFKPSALILPGVLIGYGVIGIESDGLKFWNSEIKEELNEHIDEKLTIDDFSQYAPTLAVYGLNAAGIKGRHNFRERTTILLTAYTVMAATVTTLKKTTKITRPDNSSTNSFPSGHTATAFMGAEFLWQEYKDVSPWYGIAGYAVASGTGFFRMYNDRHWFTDVVTGAGIGILSTKCAYWVNPWLTEKLFKDKSKQATSMIYPYYNGEQMGVGCVFRF